MRYLREIAAPANGACEIPAGNCDETFLSAVVSKGGELQRQLGERF
jgi:hypothetical protein